MTTIDAGFEPLLLDPAAVGRLLGCSRSRVYELHDAGKLPMPIRTVSRGPRWRAEELRDWIRAGCPPRVRWQWRGGGE